MLVRGLLGLPRYPLRALRSLPARVPEHRGHAVLHAPRRRHGRPGRRRAERRDGSGRARAPRRAEDELQRPHLAHRRFAFGQLALDDVKAVKNAHGVTVNDVVVSICAGAVRRWLIEHDELPDEPLVAQIPVSVRTDEQVGTYGNRIMLMSAPLFTDEADPVERLRAHARGARRDEGAPPRAARRAAAGRQPFHPAGRLLARGAAHVQPRDQPSGPTDLEPRHLERPGPAVPALLAGARLVANYPVSVITDGMGLNITVMSYCGHLDFGIVADRDQMPDLGC